MEEKIRKATGCVMLGLGLILCIGMVCIVVRIFTKNIILEKLNINNSITQFILDGVETSDVIDVATGDMFKSINWEEEYPFKDNNEEEITQEASSNDNQSIFGTYKTKINKLETVINDYCTNYFMNRTWFVEKAYAYDSVMDWMITPSTATDGVVFLQNDYLAQLHAKSDVASIAENVMELNEFLQENDIEFLYVQAPSKISTTDKQLPAGMEDYSNENADELIAKLDEQGINTLDFRPYMYDIADDYYGAFYKTDHHWKTTTAFQMAGVLAKYLNNNFGYEFDESYYDISNYTVEHYEKYFLGSLGKKVTLAMTEPEDYDLIVPDFSAYFRIQIPEREIDLKGDFKDTLLDYRHLQSIDYYNENCYASFMNRNDATANIQNLNPTCNQGKRILFIKDSYSTPLLPYIALGVEYLDSIYEVRYTGSVRSYIESIQPDLVVVMYSADNVTGDGDGKTSVFSLK